MSAERRVSAVRGRGGKATHRHRDGCLRSRPCREGESARGSGGCGAVVSQARRSCENTELNSVAAQPRTARGLAAVMGQLRCP